MLSRKNLLKGVLGLLAITATSAHATSFTTTSPTSEGALPAGFTEIGGIVLDLVGTNGNRVVSQRAASGLHIGYAGSNPFAIGTQTGFTASVISALGGGIAEAAVRFTLYDGDTASGNFDYNQNTLLLDGVTMGNWSAVSTQGTNSTGTSGGTLANGFHNNALRTGWFYNTSASFLSSLYTNLLDGSLTYSLYDTDPYDNYFDFTQGVDGSLIDVETGPTVTSPEPASLLLMSLAMLGLGFSRRKVKA